MSMTPPATDWSVWARGWRLLVLFLLMLVALYAVRAILLPFVVGAIAAYMFDPIASRLEQDRMSRAWASAVITVAFVLLIAVLLVAVLPFVVQQTLSLIDNLPKLFETLRTDTLPRLRYLFEHSVVARFVNLSELPNSLSERGMAVANETVTALFSSLLRVANVLALIFISPIVAFYLLRDWDKLVGELIGLVPPSQRPEARAIGHEIDEVLGGFLRGQALVCGFLAVFYGIGLMLTGLPYGLTIGLATGVFSFVPYIGMTVGVAIGMGVALASFDSWLLIVVVAGVFWLGQIIEGNFLTPKLVGARIRLHPVWVIFAILAGASLGGITGAFIAVPLAAILAVFARRLVARYKLSLNDPHNIGQ